MAQLAERNKGAKLLRSGCAADALAALERAMAILRVVRGQQPADQEEVDSNKVRARVPARAAVCCKP